MDNTSSIINYSNINFSAHNGSIDTGTASITVAFSETSPSVIQSGVMTLITTEDTAGDHNITIGSGGINDGNITLNSTDDVVVNGAINGDSFSATSGNGASGVFTSGQNGIDGERGGNININSSIQTNAGVINLTAGRGGDGSRTDVNGGVGGHGGAGGSITVNGALTANQDLSQSSSGAITVNAGDGGRGASSIDLGITTTAGNGGQGGDINITGDVTSNIDISLQTGDGQHGGAGSDISGVGGVGGSGGNIDVQGKLAAQQDINVTSGHGGAGGVGTIDVSTDGTGGDGGNAGNITLRDTVTAQRHVSLRTRSGGDGGKGRYSGGSTVRAGGAGGAGGNGGFIELRGAISAQDDVQLIISDAGDAGTGNVDGTVGSKGQIIGSVIDATASTGALTLDAIINANSGVDIQLVAGTDLTLNTGAEINATGVGNIILAAGGNFHNDTGTNNPLTVGTGRWLVYSTRPDDNRDDIAADTNAIAHDFVQYNTNFNSSDLIPVSLPAGNGFVYSVQPVLTGVSVTVNNQTINYGETISNILDTDFTVAGSGGSSYEVGGVAISAADFELTDPTGVTINAADVELNLANTVGISTAGFAAAGSYSDGIQAGVKAGSALAGQGIALSGSADLTVNQRDLNATLAADNKVYDATNIAAVSLAADNRVAGDVLSIAAGTSTFDNKNVGTGKAVSVTGATLSGKDAANYHLNISNSGTLSADITKANLNVSGASAQNKVYDQTRTATVTGGSVTALGSDVLVLGAANGLFDNKSAGTAKAVTTSFSLSGTDAGNYNLVQPTTLTADITAKTLNATLSANNKVYDASTLATVSFSDDRIAGDTLTISGASNFDSKDVGANKTVTATGLSLSGSDANNYALASTSASASADITPAALNVAANDDSKVFDGVPYSGGNGVTYAGFVGGEDASVLAGAATFGGSSQGAANPGGYVITPGGLTSSNYDITFVDGDLTINSVAANASSSDDTSQAFRLFLSLVNDGIADLNTAGNSFVPFTAQSLAKALTVFGTRNSDGAFNIPPPLAFLSWAASRGFLDDDEQ